MFTQSEATAPTAATTLLEALWPADQLSRLVRGAILVFVGSLALWVSAKIQISIRPVPITFQTLAILLIGAAYGWRLAAATVLLYLAEGFAGLPVFAGAVAGPAYFSGPTAGFLLGFLLAVIVVGGLAEKGWDRNPATLAAALLIGNITLYIPGLFWLQSFTGWSGVWAAGLLPFLYGDALKLTLAVLLLSAGWEASRRWLGRG